MSVLEPVEDVAKAFPSIQSNSARSDNLTVDIIKLCCPFILLHLTHIQGASTKTKLRLYLPRYSFLIKTQKQIDIEGVGIEPKEVVKSLRIYIDAKLRFEEHVKSDWLVDVM
ncbi:hypothetical protein HHI36_000192 [Cryptolaemus montrouzieri]|uniref:Uncharacterized protein n=1 Tax=Cryptolaemus montrouzieri TaxID=559131 RepID=A0ABD2P4A0_9CUCU